MSKLDTQETQTAMFFQPNTRHRRLQLPISERRLLLMLGDVLAVVASVLIGMRVWAWVARSPFTLDFVLPELYLFVVLIGLWLLLAGANDLYNLRIAASRRATLQRLLLVNVQMLIVYMLIFFFSPREALPRLFILYYGAASLVLIGAWRMARPALLGWASAPRRTLIVGANRAAATIIDAIREHASSDYDIRGIIGDTAEVGTLVNEVAVIGTGADLLTYVRRDRISELIITSTQSLSPDTFGQMMDAYEKGITIVPMAMLYEEMTGRVPVEHIGDDWAMVLLPMQSNDPLLRLNQMLKRGFDVVLSLVGMVLFALLLPLLALAIRLDSPGTIFYSQTRVGLNGRVFRIYKLRSMVTDAEKTTGAVFSQRGDPRVTRVGRIMRKTRLDELPQFVNVLRGDMSLIGPRPERPEHVERLTQKIPFYRTRLIVRPGVSGWAQVMYDYGSNDEDALVKLQYDLYYIRHQSILLDLNIVIRTIGKAVLFKGV
jgi:exopolysaccharide biosynthesis polyprenyl glycosylphosphotransferase